MSAAAPLSKPLIEVHNKTLITLSIMLATIMQVLDTTIANVALPSMQADLGASADTINWVLTSYIVAAAIVTALTGWMADRLGRKRLFLISVAAELAGMHAQTLRTYDRLGLVSPERTSGGGRRYSQRDVDLLREVQRLSQDEGVNLAGIKRIIELTNQVEALQAQVRADGFRRMDDEQAFLDDLSGGI